MQFVDQRQRNLDLSLIEQVAILAGQLVAVRRRHSGKRLFLEVSDDFFGRCPPPY